MTDKLMIQLPFADVKRELQAAWEATRARLQPPKPALNVALEGDHAALYQVYDRDFSQAQSVVTLLALRLTANGQYSLLDVGTCTHDKARAWAIFEEWLGVFKQNLPGLKPIILYSEWLQRNAPVLADDREDTSAERSPTGAAIMSIPEEPPENAGYEDWFKWYHIVKDDLNFRFTLKDLATKMYKSHNTVRKLHADYMAEHGTKKEQKRNN